MGNHFCARCQRSDLSETDFDFTPAGRRQKNCRRCIKQRRAEYNARYYSPKSGMWYVRGVGLVAADAGSLMKGNPMARWTFKPEVPSSDSIKVPCIEDARADYAPYYSSRKSLIQSMSDVTAELGKLDAGVLEFQRGLFEVNGQNRHGYRIKFIQGGRTGMIRIAGLPMRTPTPNKENQVRVQALLIVCDWLQSAVTAKVFNPDMQPLLPFLLLPDGQTTVAEYITSGAVMLLPEESTK